MLLSTLGSLSSVEARMTNYFVKYHKTVNVSLEYIHVGTFPWQIGRFHVFLVMKKHILVLLPWAYVTLRMGGKPVFKKWMDV